VFVREKARSTIRAPTLFTVTLDITLGIKDPVDHG